MKPVPRGRRSKRRKKTRKRHKATAREALCRGKVKSENRTGSSRNWSSMVEEKFDDLVEELMKNPRFKEEYEALRPEFEAVRSEMDTQTDGRRDAFVIRTRVGSSRAVVAQ